MTLSAVKVAHRADGASDLATVTAAGLAALERVGAGKVA
jgi:hypothetical protein